MKTELDSKQLIALVASVAPFVCVCTIWTHDECSGPISKECDGFTSDEDDDWTAWNSEVRASLIQDGEMISVSDFLGGTFEKAGDDPAQSNPDISGYFSDMLFSALTGLRALAKDAAQVEAIEQAIALVRSK